MNLGIYKWSNTNRWLSPDTIVPDPTNPQSYNRYSYVLNSPVNFNDPTGHCAEFGDDECWNAYDRIVNMCDYCADVEIVGKPLHEQTGRVLIEYRDQLFTGWRPPSPPREPTHSPRQTSSFEDVVFPDAIILPGVSGSATGPYAIVGGAEIVVNLDSEEVDIFTYMGQGSGLGLEADAAWYAGFVWNLDQNIDYEGVFHTLTVELSFIEGAQASFFWEDGSIPFTGETWGISGGQILLGGGASGAYTQTDFDQRLKLK